MHLSVEELSAFYLTPLGRVVRQHVRSEIGGLWPTAKAERLVGLGHTTPYLRPFLGEAERVMAFMPAGEGVLHWPSEGPNMTALSFETELPLPDASVDRVLMVHCLEGTAEPFEVMREVWRVLVPSGMVLVVAPYRSGPWARADHTPFGLGRPFSRYQLSELMASALFDVTRSRRFLFTPPSGRRFVLAQTRAWERIGSQVWPRFAGMVAMEATKVMTRGVPAKKTRRSLPIFVPALRPAPTARMPAGQGGMSDQT